MNEPAVRVGDDASAIPTPALVVDLDVFERNLKAMADWATLHRIALRPHAKAHKSAEIAALQMAAGAVGVCVQTLGEAEALVAAGRRSGQAVDDIHLSNELIDPAKFKRFMALAESSPSLRLSLTVDSSLVIDRLAEAARQSPARERIAVLVEIDVGQGRCGAPPSQAGRLARQVVSHGLRFAGLQAYQGKAQHLRTATERQAASLHAAQLARAGQASVTATGVSCPRITGGGTGTFCFDAASGVYTEVQPGSYLFMDADYERNELAGGAPHFEPSLFIRSQVISRGVSHAVVDAGTKSVAVDAGMPRVWSRSGSSPVDYRSGGDEHGTLHGRAPLGLRAGTSPATDALPQLGEAVWLVPGHCDPTVNLHDHLLGVRGGLERGTVERIFTVDARGRSA